MKLSPPLALAALLVSTPALAQYPGQIPTNTVLGNLSGVNAPARPIPLPVAVSIVAGCGLSVNTNIILASGRRPLTDADGDVNLATTDNLDSLTDTLTTSRFWFLPLAASLPAGCTLKVADEQGGITDTEQLYITTSGVDLINGGAIYPLDGPYQAAYMQTDGVATWTVTANVLKAGCDAGGGTVDTLAKFVTDPYATCGDSLITNVSPDILASPGANGHFIVQVESASGDGGIRLSSGNGLATTDGGGNINLTTGNGAPSGDGGNINATLGNGGGTTGNGGSVTLTAGGATSGAAGSIVALGGESLDGNGGNVFIAGGAGNFGQGGTINIVAGNLGAGGGLAGTFSGRAGTALAGSGADGGNTELQGGSGDINGAGGSVALLGGTGGATSGDGGRVVLTPGNAGGTGTGGWFELAAGESVAGSGGYFVLRPKRTVGTQSTVPGDANYKDGYIQFFSTHIVGGLGAAGAGVENGTIGTCGGGTPAFETTGDNDTRGVITVGTGAVTACTLTFKRTWNAIDNGAGAYVVPKCFANNIGATPNAISISARSITAVTFTFAADINTTGGKFAYWCVQ